MSDSKLLVLVDGSALAFRSFYALYRSGLKTPTGEPSWAVYGFFKALLDLIEKQKPDMVAVCFDRPEPTFRHLAYDQYKANRTEMPEELVVQWPWLKEGVRAFNIPVYELPGYEADDIIGTVAKDAEAKGYAVSILTGDQDSFQLLDNSISVLMPGKDGLVRYGRNEVHAKIGVWPEQITDYKGLSGDSSDNIPGVKGIGPKTAVSLLELYQNIEGLYENIDQLKGSTKQKLLDGRDLAFTSKDLATIRLDVPIEFDFDHCALTMPDVDQTKDFLARMGFKTILGRLPVTLIAFNGGVQPDLAPLATKEDMPTEAVQNSNLPALDFQVINESEQLEKLVALLAKQSVLCVDLETTSVDSLNTTIVGYALAWSEDLTCSEDGISGDFSQIKSVYIPVGHFAQKQLDPDFVIEKLAPILSGSAEPGKNIAKVAQNAKFEMNVLSTVGIDFGPIAFDPMLASYVVNPDQNHGLKDQSYNLLQHEMTRITELIGQGRKQISMDKVTVEQAAPYACDDARITLALVGYYMHNLDQEQKALLKDMEIPLVSVLSLMEQNGVALDLRYLKELSKLLGDSMSKLEAEIFEYSGRPFNLNSPSQMQKVLFEDLGLPAKAKTKSGYSTDASVLESLVDKHPIVAKILEYRQLTKLKSTYVDALPKSVLERDGRLHGEFHQAKTSTGRLSSSNPNLQNIPIRTELGRAIRKAFIPGDADSVLLSADYSQIELRLLAHMSQDPTLIEAFKLDQDIHARTAMEVYDVPLNEVTADMRRLGKTINFSLVYQQGAYSTGLDLGISTKEAQAFMDKYFSRYPKVKSFMQKTIDEARQKGYSTTLWGRKRYFHYLNDKREGVKRADERAACNHPLQGSAADLMKLAMVRLYRDLKVKQLQSKLILQVHDELVLDVKRNELDCVKELVVDAMSLDQPFDVPLKVDVHIGENWMEAK